MFSSKVRDRRWSPKSQTLFNLFQFLVGRLSSMSQTAVARALPAPISSRTTTPTLLPFRMRLNSTGKRQIVEDRQLFLFDCYGHSHHITFGPPTTTRCQSGEEQVPILASIGLTRSGLEPTHLRQTHKRFNNSLQTVEVFEFWIYEESIEGEKAQESFSSQRYLDWFHSIARTVTICC